MVMVSPYLSMLRSGSSIPAGDFNIAIDKLENALKMQKVTMNLSALREKVRSYYASI